jgi:hypothetical protein
VNPTSRSASGRGEGVSGITMMNWVLHFLGHHRLDEGIGPSTASLSFDVLDEPVS